MAGNFTRFPDVFFHQVDKYGDRTALRRKDYGIWNRISWREYGRRVRELAAGLLALGLEPGRAVCVLGDNRPEWLVCHLGSMTAGGLTCGVYPTSAADEIRFIVQHSEAQVFFVENEEQVDKVLEIIDELDVAKVVIWERKGLFGFNHPRFMFYDEFLEMAAKFQADNPEAVDERYAAVKPDDVAMMVYTSGTTGRPKGAMITHANIVFMTESFTSAMGAYETDELLSYLPLAHIYENLISVFQAIWSGATVNFVESLDTLAPNLNEVSPTIFASVPRIWEKFASAIEIRMKDSTYFKRFWYRLALNVGRKWFRAQNGQGNLFWWSIAYWPLYWLVLYNLKRVLGFERIRYAVCGAAPASPELFEFYNSLGIKLREGYGQTESTGVIALTRPDNPRWGYVGEPLPGVGVKVAEDGEILCNGPGVFKGYFKAPELTAETIVDGWLHTGDVGALEDGFLKIMDRKKDIIITRGGKNITPAYIENKLKFSHYVQDAVVIGEGRKFLTALILIDEDNVTKYATENRVPFTTFADLTQNPEINKLIDGEIRTVNKDLARVETVKKFRLLPRRFYAEDGDVTPTQKVKRRSLEERYKDMIDEMYRG